MAEEQEANLILRLKDEATAGINKFKAGVAAAAAAVAGLTAFMIDSFKSFMASEEAVNKLNAALKNQGIFSKQLSGEMQGLAKELQRQTTFSDEAIISAETLLTTFGIAGKTMKGATQAALDLSAGLGLDLNTASMLIGKSFVGATETLGRYGIKIDESIPKSERFAAVMDAVNARFGGRAQADLDTTAGRIKNLIERFDDLKEKIGSELVPVFEFWIEKIEKTVGWLEKITNASEDDLTVRELTIQKLTEEREAIIANNEARSVAYGSQIALTEAERNRVISLTDQLVLLREAAAEEKAVVEQKLLDHDIMTNRMIENNNRMSESEKKLWDKKVQAAREANINVKKAQADGYQAYLDNNQQVRKEEIEHNKFKIETLQTTLGNISALQEAHNKFLAGVGKAAAYAAAIINTSLGITIALRSTPFAPVNVALASVVAAAGAAQIAAISGAKLADGGIVMPRPGGMQATIGEAGQAEAVIPLGSSNARDQLNAAGIGGEGTTINLEVGILLGSQDSVRELAKMIDKELFSLRRNNESIAFESI